MFGRLKRNAPALEKGSWRMQCIGSPQPTLCRSGGPDGTAMAAHLQRFEERHAGGLWLTERWPLAHFEQRKVQCGTCILAAVVARVTALLDLPMQELLAQHAQRWLVRRPARMWEQHCCVDHLSTVRRFSANHRFVSVLPSFTRSKDMSCL
jgi:hypothetical protein